MGLNGSKFVAPDLVSMSHKLPKFDADDDHAEAAYSSDSLWLFEYSAADFEQSTAIQ